MRLLVLHVQPQNLKLVMMIPLLDVKQIVQQQNLVMIVLLFLQDLKLSLFVLLFVLTMELIILTMVTLNVTMVMQFQLTDVITVWKYLDGLVLKQHLMLNQHVTITAETELLVQVKSVMTVTQMI